MHNRWCSYDATDPIVVWELAVPAPSPSEQESVVDAVVAAGRASGVMDLPGWPPNRTSRPVVEQRVGEWLPYEDALFEGAAVPFLSKVFVRDGQGNVVEHESNDAGALLKSLEPLDDAYARRFAASHPFVGAFTTTKEKSLQVHVCFFSSLYFDEKDAELHAKNQQRLLQLRDALLQVARARGGKLVAPTTTTKTQQQEQT